MEGSVHLQQRLSRGGVRHVNGRMRGISLLWKRRKKK